MSVIEFSQVGNGMCAVFCPHCSVRVGLFDPDEIVGMSRVGVVPVCFDCDPLNVDKVPDHLKLPEEIYLLMLGDQPFVCQWDNAGFHWANRLTFLQWATLLEPNLWAGAPLSSSTYLHATKPNIGDGGDE